MNLNLRHVFTISVFLRFIIFNYVCIYIHVSIDVWRPQMFDSLGLELQAAVNTMTLRSCRRIVCMLLAAQPALQPTLITFLSMFYVEEINLSVLRNVLFRMYSEEQRDGKHKETTLFICNEKMLSIFSCNIYFIP